MKLPWDEAPPLFDLHPDNDRRTLEGLIETRRQLEEMEERERVERENQRGDAWHIGFNRF